LTYRRFEEDIRFIEHPFIFYPVSSGLIFWDYLRHGGLLRCPARKLTRFPHAHATAAQKGRAFENDIKTSLAALPGVTTIKAKKIRVGRQDLWDVDVGFVFQNVLFLIDAKNEQKNVRYYFDGAEVSDIVESHESLLEKMDRKLQQYRDIVRNSWKECEAVRGAICVVCTVEAEFIASVSPSFWLKPLEVPRICMPAELMEFLSQTDAISRVQANPAYLAFPN
jgi:hypothetical protein